MPFNSDTYYANKYRRSAWDYLTEARKRRDDGDIAGARISASLARSSMHLHVMSQRLADMNRLFKKVRNADRNANPADVYTFFRRWPDLGGGTYLNDQYKRGLAGIMEPHANEAAHAAWRAGRDNATKGQPK